MADLNFVSGAIPSQESITFPEDLAYTIVNGRLPVHFESIPRIN